MKKRDQNGLIFKVKNVWQTKLICKLLNFWMDQSSYLSRKWKDAFLVPSTHMPSLSPFFCFLLPNLEIVHESENVPWDWRLEIIVLTFKWELCNFHVEKWSLNRGKKVRKWATFTFFFLLAPKCQGFSMFSLCWIRINVFGVDILK